MYFLTVFLCMFSSRAIPRMDSPLRFAVCNALHLAVCNGVGFLRVGVAVLRTRAVPLRPEASTVLHVNHFCRSCCLIGKCYQDFCSFNCRSQL